LLDATCHGPGLNRVIMPFKSLHCDSNQRILHYRDSAHDSYRSLVAE
jgi:hypothetical protein